MALKRTVETASMSDVTCCAFAPTRARLTPKITAKNSTWSTSLRASASNEVVGMMLKRKVPTPPPWSLWAFSAWVVMALASSVDGSMFIP